MKNAARSALFLLSLFFAISVFSPLLPARGGHGTYGISKFYELDEKSVDVLVLGNSHAWAGVSTAVLYDEFGIAAYDLGGGFQTMWQTYHYLKEALKTQRPKLIVLEMSSSMSDAKNPQSLDTMMGNIFPMKWSMNKIDALRASVSRETLAEFLRECVYYHRRNGIIERHNTLARLQDVMYEGDRGFITIDKTTPVKVPDIGKIVATTKMPKKSESYYRRILKLAKDSQIPVMSVVAPYAEYDEDYSAAKKIADKYGAAFIDFNKNYKKIGLDFNSDFAESSHLNYRGSVKYTRSLGKLLKKNYNLPDRRHDGAYASWKADAENIDAKIRQWNMRREIDPQKIINFIKSENYTLFVSTDGAPMEDEKLSAFIRSLGVTSKNGEGIWVVDGKNIVKEISGEKTGKEYIELDGNDFLIERKKDGKKSKNRVSFGRKEYKRLESGVQVVVYSKKLKTVVDGFSIGKKSEYKCVR